MSSSVRDPIIAARRPIPSPTKRRRRAGSEGKPPHPITQLGDDLLVEVLIRSLPDPISIYRCKLVCKRWASLISHPSFNRRFISHRRPLLLPSNNPHSVLNFLPVPAEARTHLSVSDCFMDLVLCRFQEGSIDDEELGRTYLVCNPFAKQWIALPLAPERPEGSCRMDARLVCEPHRVHNFDIGDGQVCGYCSEYRFQVVRTYQTSASIHFDMFCSESGKWTQRFLNVDCDKLRTFDIASWGREVLFGYVNTQKKYKLCFVNPFHFDESIDEPEVSSYHAKFLLRGWSTFSVSQGALHVIMFDADQPGGGCGGRNLLSVWRRKQGDNMSFDLVYDKVLAKEYCDYKTCEPLALHPEKPEIVYLDYLCPQKGRRLILSCNMMTASPDVELREVTAASQQYFPRWKLFLPRVSCWPTPIPRYRKLRGLYDGSYDCFAQGRGREVIRMWRRCVKQAAKGG